MKYKTTIEIVSEAENKNEAIEIVGEYLGGNLVSGVDMKCRTNPIQPYNKNMLSVVVISLLVTIGGFSMTQLRPSIGSIQGTSTNSAIQPPLKTAETEKKDAEFKKEWQSKQIDKALSFIKR